MHHIQGVPAAYVCLSHSGVSGPNWYNENRHNSLLHRSVQAGVQSELRNKGVGVRSAHTIIVFELFPEPLHFHIHYVLRTEIGRKSLAFQGACRWNSPPPNLTNMSHPTSLCLLPGHAHLMATHAQFISCSHCALWTVVSLCCELSLTGVGVWSNGWWSARGGGIHQQDSLL